MLVRGAYLPTAQALQELAPVGKTTESDAFVSSHAETLPVDLHFQKLQAFANLSRRDISRTTKLQMKYSPHLRCCCRCPWRSSGIRSAPSPTVQCLQGSPRTKFARKQWSLCRRCRPGTTAARPQPCRCPARTTCSWSLGSPRISPKCTWCKTTNPGGWRLCRTGSWCRKWPSPRRCRCLRCNWCTPTRGSPKTAPRSTWSS